MHRLRRKSIAGKGLGENGTVFASRIVSFNLNNGALNWQYDAPEGTKAKVIAATDGVAWQ